MRTALVCTVAVLSALVGACSRAEREQPRAELRPVTLPDTSRLDASVATQMKDRLDAIRRLRPDSDVQQRVDAYASMGKLLMAAEFYEAAEPALLNAQTLAPSDPRWPYLLGHVFRFRGDAERATRYFEQALTLQPDDEAALVWIGQLHLAAGRTDEAQRSFERAVAVQPRSAPALIGLGRVALARNDAAAAAARLEEALAAEPRASTAHYPLGLAYRALGQTARAEAHLKQRVDGDLAPPDPVLAELETILESPLEYEIRGDRALAAGDWPAAIQAFREGVARAPRSAVLKHKLGTALFLAGDTTAAGVSFEEALRLAPNLAKAHYSLGVIAAADGRTSEALARFSTAIRSDPGYVEARLALADTLRRTGRPDEALPQYVELLKRDPASAQGSFGSAMALVRLRRFDEAVKQLEDGARMFPEQPAFVHTLARLLAATPDDRVRNAARAIATIEPLLAREPTLDLGETMAMALSNAGRFGEAVSWQRDVLAAAQQAGQTALLPELRANLRLYEAGRPCRTPWVTDPELSA